MKLVNFSGEGHFTSIMIGTALVSVANPSFKNELRLVLETAKLMIYERSIDQFIALYPELTGADIDNITMYNNMQPSHYVFGTSILLNLIEKNLNSTNYSAWISRRKRSYANPLGLTEFDPLLALLVPSQIFAERFYNNSRVYFPLRRLLFLNIYGISKNGDLLGNGMSVALTLLKYAEMANWALISYWLLELNPDLLMWNELAKYWPAICAAASKFASLGEFAPWAKLAFPPDELPEFSAEKLALPYVVARALSQKYGNQTVNQLLGAKQDSTTKEIVACALTIVRIAGGAKTVDVMALRAWRYNGHCNPRLEEALDTGALDKEINPANDPEPRRRQLNEALG